MKPTSYLVVHRTTRSSPTLYFGPFVSEAIAYQFQSCLPVPASGGFSEVTVVQPFTSCEAHIAGSRLKQ